MNIKKLLVVTTVIISLSCGSITALAKENAQDYVSILVENGYSTETAEALPTKEQIVIAEKLLEAPEDVDISTFSMEVDMLSEIESFFKYSEDELVAMGATKEKIADAKKELLHYYGLSDAELAQTLNIDATEAKMFKKAIEAGLEFDSENVIRKAGVSASGSITSSEMTYTQTKTNNSTSSAPAYEIKLSYTWKEVYALAILDDKIVAAWGGGLNTKDISSSAKYYDYRAIGGSFGSYYKSKKMTKTETVQAGIEFEFPQSYANPTAQYAAKTKTGYAQFTLYQTQYQGYDTKVLSNYCHKVISIGGGSIDISASGPSVSLSIGYGYDTTTQKASTIAY